MNRSYRSLLTLLLVAQAVSEFGDWLIFIFVVTTIYSLSKSAVLLGVFFTIQSVTTIAVAPYAGYVLERIGVARLLYTGRFLQSSSLLLPLAVAVLTREHRWLILSLFATFPILRAVDVVLGIGVSALLPQLFSGKELVRANAAFSTASNLLVVVMPALSGFLVAYLSFSQALTIDLASYAVAGLVILPALTRLTSAARGLRSTNENAAGRPGEGFFNQIGRLLKVVKALPVARYATLVIFIFMIGGGAINAIMPAFALMIGDARTFGYMTSLTGAGFLITSAALTFKALAISPRKMVAAGLGVIAAADLAWYTAHEPALAVAIAFVNGVGNELFGLGFTTFLQTGAKARHLPRLLAAVSLAREGASAVSPVFGGALGGLLGVRSVFLFAAALTEVGIVASSLASGRIDDGEAAKEPTE